MSDTFNSLIEMGFSKKKAEKAVSETGDVGIEAAMEWLLEHNEDKEFDEPKTCDEKAVHNDATDVVEESEEIRTEIAEIDESQPKSLLCDECGKKFKSEAEVEFHAVKSGHQSFSESMEEIKPLTDEEKKDRLKKIEEKIKERRLQREEQTKKEEIEKEKARRKIGQEVALAKQRFEEEEMRKIAEQTRKEKTEKLLARQKVLEEIERDKQARREKFGSGNSPAPEQSHSNSVQPTQTPQTKSYEECRLQIRLTNGKTLTQVFKPNEELAAVRLYIQLNRTDGSEPFMLMTNFPRKVFTEEDMEKPLKSLGLVPSAVLILTKTHG